MFEEFKNSMMIEFDMSDLGMMHYFLGIEVVQSTNGIFISQKKYVGEILDRFQMKNCNPVSTPTELGLMPNKDLEGKKVDGTLYKQLVGSLMYLTATRLDIMHSEIKMIKGALRVMFLCSAQRLFHGLIYCHLVNNEAKFVAATACACQAIWLRRILEELQFKQTEATIVFCDNNSAIKLSKNPVLHGRSKHIDVKYYFLRDLSIDGTIDLKYYRSEVQLADIFTKPLRFLPFQKLRRLLGMCTLENSH
ncbi:hypothetical protein RJ639_002952 [Escallonia herrerae]|uniref:Reverse transcriptase Ty1/copia-type domain-containing protein n=1 Tax=Escallonia herrerae TaxID=1293975 RepID=A0AA89AYY0_9ASTE|nr:hypothetical protein RJ639_002952 [Escallonia herrerae]